MGEKAGAWHTMCREGHFGKKTKPVKKALPHQRRRKRREGRRGRHSPQGTFTRLGGAAGGVPSRRRLFFSFLPSLPSTPTPTIPIVTTIWNLRIGFGSFSFLDLDGGYLMAIIPPPFLFLPSRILFLLSSLHFFAPHGQVHKTVAEMARVKQRHTRGGRPHREWCPSLPIPFLSDDGFLHSHALRFGCGR